MKKLSFLTVLLLVLMLPLVSAVPDAVFTTTPQPAEGVVPLTVQFNAENSTGNGSLNYAWDFTNDGEIDATGETASHTYTAANTYTAALTVTDNEGNNTATKAITVNARDISVNLTNVPLQLEVFRDDSAEPFTVDLYHAGNVDLTASLAISDLESGDYTLSAADYIDITSSPGTLSPTDTDAFEVTLKKLPATTVPGTYTGTVTVTASDVSPEDYAAEDVEITGTIQVTVEEKPTGASLAFSVDTIDFGSDTQEREETIEKTFRVRNTGIETVTGIAFTPSTSLEDYSPEFSPSTFSLTSLQEQTVTMSITIPDDQDAGTDEIGSVALAAASPASVDFPSNLVINLETISHLDITDIEYDIVDGDSDDLDVDDKTRDEFDDDVQPGEEVELSVTVENTFDESIEIEDVKVRIEDEDSELDFVNDDDETSGIDDGDEHTFEFTFRVEDDADDDTYEFIIEVEGTDENGADHFARFIVEVPVDQPSDDITIRQVDVSPSPVSCESQVRVDVVIENTGKDDQRRAAVELESDFFDLKKRETNIDIDEDDDYTARFSISVADLEPGTYPVDVFAYYDITEDYTDVEFFDLVVRECGTDTDDGDTDDTDDTDDYDADENQTPPDFGDFPTGNVVYGEEEDEPNWLVLGLLAAAIVLVIILIVVLVVNASSKK